MIRQTQLIIALVWAAYLALLVSPLYAQSDQYREPLPDQHTFTVEQAVAYGLVHNPGLRSVRKTNEIAEGEVINAAILRNSAISVAYARERTRSGSTGGHAGGEEPMEPAHEEEHEGEDEGEPEEGMEHEEATGGGDDDDPVTRGRTRTFSIFQRFDLAGQRPIRILRSRADLDRVRLQIAEAEIDLVRTIKRASAEYLALTDEMAEIHNVMYSAKPPIWEATKERPNDRLRAMVEFLRMQQDSRLTRQLVMRTETEITTLLGLPADTRLMIIGNLDPQAIPMDYEELKRLILSRNLGIQSILIELRAARYTLQMAMQSKVPGVDVGYIVSRDRGEGAASRTQTFSVSLSADFIRQLIEQNRGDVLSARGNLEATEDALQHARWELENELYAIYKDLDLTRVRIRVLEDGYLPHLKLLIEEQDVEDYEAGKIELDTWANDVMRYHMDGETMLALKAAYASTVATLEFLAGGSFTAPVQVPQESLELPEAPNGYLAGVFTKAGRGIGNILLSPIEFPAGWYGYTADRGILGALGGVLDGTVTVVERAAAGALDLVTAPIPWPIERMQPVSHPVWGENVWTGSWSLRYIHPAYNYEPAYNYGQENLTERRR